jgi:hydrogenase nickel incorporation protein HypA/HybF
MSLISALLRGVEAKLAEVGGKRVRSIRLAVGLLSGAEPDLLESAFAVLSEGTACEGAQLMIRRPPVRVRCGACGAEVELLELSLRCPKCNGFDLELEGGDELFIEEMEVEFGEPQHPGVREDPEGQ